MNLFEVITCIPDSRDESGKATVEVKAFYAAETAEQVWEETATDRMDERTEFIGICKSVPILKVIQKSMSDIPTPRTDAEEIDSVTTEFIAGFVVSSAFARQLERELNAATKSAGKWKGMYTEAHAINSNLRTELAAISQNAEVSEVAVADQTKTSGVRPPLSLD